eukprot:1259919-Amphidinium_carterae.1
MEDWLPAVVLKVDGDGGLVMDLKPNTWITKEQQATSIRPRRTGHRDTAIKLQPEPAKRLLHRERL